MGKIKSAKPCPFCGSDPITAGAPIRDEAQDDDLMQLAIFDDDFNYPIEEFEDAFRAVFLMCNECSMRGPEAKVSTAIEVWNRRVAQEET